MSQRRLDPLQDLLNLQERMNRLFEESLKGRLETDSSPRGWQPLADVYETQEAFVVLVELPGVDPDDVEIQMDGDSLTVRGERSVSSSARPECYYRMERSYGSFSRSFQLTAEVQPDGVTAQFKDGLLRLEAPKIRGRG